MMKVFVAGIGVAAAVSLAVLAGRKLHLLSRGFARDMDEYWRERRIEAGDWRSTEWTHNDSNERPTMT